MAKRVKICAECGKKKEIVGKGLCNACYQKKRRRELPKVRDVRLPPSAEQRPTQFETPLSQDEIDVLAMAAAQATPEPPDLTVPGGEEARGHEMLREYLESHDYIARREVIRQMLGLGLTELQVMTTFYNDEKLRKRWIDAVNNPLKMFATDFLAIKKDRRPSTMSAASITTYVERQKVFLRMIHRLAADESCPATVRSTLLQAGIKLARDIALAEGAIHVVPGQGDMPVRRRGQPDEAPESAADEGDDGIPRLRRVRVGEGEFQGDEPEDSE